MMHLALAGAWLPEDPDVQQRCQGPQQRRSRPGSEEGACTGLQHLSAPDLSQTALSPPGLLFQDFAILFTHLHGLLGLQHPTTPPGFELTPRGDMGLSILPKHLWWTAHLSTASRSLHSSSYVEHRRAKSL